MKTLEKIKAAAKMGYSAKLERWKVVGISGEIIYTKDENGICAPLLLSPEYLEITGFLYVGMLFGEPEIPEGQRFRVKETGEKLRFEESLVYKNGFLFIDEEGNYVVYSKEELEPAFD